MNGQLDVYNPDGKPIEDLPVIYGFNNGGHPLGLVAIALSADGVELGSHLCSHEGYMPSDLGLTPGSRREDRKETYRKHYPGGYRIEFVPYDDENAGLDAAIEEATRRREAGEKLVAGDAPQTKIEMTITP